MDITKIPGAVAWDYKKGSYIVRQDEEIEFVYYLTQGKCYRTFVNEQGEEIVFSYWEKEECIGALALMGDPVWHRSNTSMIAQTDCKGYKIPTENFLEIIDQDIELCKKLLHRAVIEIREINKNYIHMKDGRIANRVCQIFIEKAVCREGRYIVHKKFNNLELARYLGVHPVTISRIMKVLKEEKLIKRGQEGIVLLDREKLLYYSKEGKLTYK